MRIAPFKGGLRYQDNFTSAGSSAPGTTVPAHATLNSSKGTVTELLASLDFDCHELFIYCTGYGAAAASSKGFLSIYVGAATEQVLIPDLLIGGAGGAGLGGKRWRFPIYIPAGTRVSAALGGERTGVNANVAIMAVGGTMSPHVVCGSKVVTYGLSTQPDATNITPGASGAEGSFTQITASTTENHIAVMPSWQPPTDTTLNARIYSVDIGIGSATEAIIARLEGPYIYQTNASEQCSTDGYDGVVYADIPSGSRLAARVSNNGTNDGSGADRGQVALHCLSL